MRLPKPVKFYTTSVSIIIDNEPLKVDGISF